MSELTLGAGVLVLAIAACSVVIYWRAWARTERAARDALANERVADAAVVRRLGPVRVRTPSQLLEYRAARRRLETQGDQRLSEIIAELRAREHGGAD